MAYDEAERAASLPSKVLWGTEDDSAPSFSPIESISDYRDVGKSLGAVTSSVPVLPHSQSLDHTSALASPWTSSIPASSLPAPSSYAPSTPLRNITNRGLIPRTTTKKAVMLCSPISISSDSSHDESDDSSTPATSPILIVESTPGWRSIVTKRTPPSARLSLNMGTSRTSSVTMSAPTVNSPPLSLSNLKRKVHWPSDEPRALKKPKQHTHLELFFAGYPRFQYDPAAPVSAQYDALCRVYGFFRPRIESAGGAIKSERQLKAARDTAYAGFQRAMARTFAEKFGTDVNDLGNWQSLCRVLEIAPVPQKMWACRAAVREVHVNLVDLVDWGGMGAPVQKFETLEELAHYTKMTRKFFPQGEAMGGLLQFLLRHVF
ncbi:hypothetical protein B0H19DRAFT_1154728 [Mycena capillaripes]|nr:hypothetical protein B0H19DRAFT_1154728 [Mycena capillaripes]